MFRLAQASCVAGVGKGASQEAEKDAGGQRGRDSLWEDDFEEPSVSDEVVAAQSAAARDAEEVNARSASEASLGKAQSSIATAPDEPVPEDDYGSDFEEPAAAKPEPALKPEPAFKSEPALKPEPAFKSEVDGANGSMTMAAAYSADFEDFAEDSPRSPTANTLPKEAKAG